MKLFRESLIIFSVYLLGEVLSSILHIPIPGNILGMIILFILLCTKIIKVDYIANITNFLLNHLAFFFIPAGVGLMSSLGVIKSTWWQLLIVCLLTTILIIGITGRVVQVIVKNKKDVEIK